MQSGASMLPTGLSKPSPAAAKEREATRVQLPLRGSAVRTAPSSGPTGRSISATPRTTGSASSSGKIRGGRAPRLSAEKVAQCGGEVFRVVALHGVAGLGNRDPVAIEKAPRETFGVLVVEHVALAAAHDEGRTGDPREPVGETAPLGGVLVAAHLLKPPPVVLPDPGSVGLLPQIVHQAAPQDQRVAPRVERHCPLDDRLQSLGLRSAVDKIADSAGAGAAHIGAGV